MKVVASILLASAGLASAAERQCSTSSGIGTNEGGNWFCGAVKQIVYEGFKQAGSFQAVTSMQLNADGDCPRETKQYQGCLGPFCDDMTLSFRGPLELKEAAVYNLASTSSKSKHHARAEASPDARLIRRGSSLRHRHLHRSHLSKRADIVHAVIDGIEQSWENNYFGPGVAAPPASDSGAKSVVQEPEGHAAPLAVQVSGDSGVKTDASSAPSVPPSVGSESKGSPAPSGSDWDRIAYYNAEQQISENMVFMGNYGGEGSGVFDNVFGNSLSYLNANGVGGSAKPEILSDVTLPSNKEFLIFSAEKCDDSCGFSRAKDVAYKGFAGGNKIFILRFKMPHDNNANGFNADMPSVWALNGRIPRTAQYHKCSCWKSGCGEVDIFEVLRKGDNKCKSAFHVAQDDSGGSSDYFDRPVGEFVNVATVFHEQSNSISIKVLPDNFDFPKGLDDATVTSWRTKTSAASSSGSSDILSSLFQFS